MELKGIHMKDYNALREWCVTVYDFYSSIDNSFMGKYITKSFMDVVKMIDKKHSLRLMKAQYKETNEMFREMLTPEQISSLNMILKEKFNHSIDDEINNDAAKIEKIIKRGRIRNDREFELVRNRENAIYSDDSQWDYAESLRKLMLDYEDRESV